MTTSHELFQGRIWTSYGDYTEEFCNHLASLSPEDAEAEEAYHMACEEEACAHYASIGHEQCIQAPDDFVEPVATWVDIALLILFGIAVALPAVYHIITTN